MGLLVLLIALMVSPASARGRKPDHDNYPDYNRIEFRKKLPEPVPESPAPTPPNVALPPPPVSPSTKGPNEPETLPKPPPAAVPVSANDSEPVLPDDMMKSLVPGATGQNPAPGK